MSEVTLEAIKALREQTGLPIMECKAALIEARGIPERAIEILRKRGLALAASRAGRQTAEGRIACGLAPSAAALVELRCETAPVANNADFQELVATLARELATQESVTDPDTLLQRTPSDGKSPTLGEMLADVQNRLRENIVLARFLRWEGRLGRYVHHDGRKAALIEVPAAPADSTLPDDLCKHIVAMHPQVLRREDLDAATVAKEKEIITEQARQSEPSEEARTEEVERRLRLYYAEHVLDDQPYALDPSRTVGTVLKEARLKIVRFVRWEVGAPPTEAVAR